MRVIDFLKFYILNVVKTWWSALLFIPVFISNLSKLFAFLGFKNKDIQEVAVIEDWFTSNGVLALVLIFLIINVIKFYSLWKEREEVFEYDNLPESYKLIIEKMNSFMPSKSSELKEDFARGHKCLYEADSKDINTAVAIHFAAYKIIRDFLIDYLRDSGTSVEITVEASEIRSKFDNNFFKLEEYNCKIGTNEGALDELQVQKLIRDINDNLNSLIGYL